MAQGYSVEQLVLGHWAAQDRVASRIAESLHVKLDTAIYLQCVEAARAGALRTMRSRAAVEATAEARRMVEAASLTAPA